MNTACTPTTAVIDLYDVWRHHWLREWADLGELHRLREAREHIGPHECFSCRVERAYEHDRDKDAALGRALWAEMEPYLASETGPGPLSDILRRWLSEWNVLRQCVTYPASPSSPSRGDGNGEGGR